MYNMSIPDLKRKNRYEENYEAHYCLDENYLRDGSQYQDPAWVEQVILVGWAFYEEWCGGFESSILNMMRTYHIRIPDGAGKLLAPTPDGRCGLVHGLVRTYYLESHSDPNWAPYVSLCSLTQPVAYREIASINLPLCQLSEMLSEADKVFVENRPFFYALFHMIQLFSSPQGDWTYGVNVCFKPYNHPLIEIFDGALPDLPMELMIYILSFLDGVSIYQMSKVNHLWRIATHSKALQYDLGFPDPQISYLINFTAMGMGGNCGPSY
jgi:hypothetical protein